MTILLFCHEDRTCIEGRFSADSRFRHQFGGCATELGFRFTNVDEPCPLLFGLDTGDSTLPIGMFACRYLPLCYPFSYEGYEGNFAYAVNDREIEVVYPDALNDDPYYPGHFVSPRIQSIGIEFVKRHYDFSLAADSIEMAGVFGLNHLDPDAFADAIAMKSTDLQQVRQDEFVVDCSDAEILEGICQSPFIQAAPTADCLRRSCQGKTLVFALFETQALSMLELVGELDQIVFQFCTSCNCINVSNQCS